MAVVTSGLRRFTLPVVVLVPPPLFLLYREVAICWTPAGCNGVAIAGFALLVLLASVCAWLVVRTVASGRAPRWLAPRPCDGTLAVLGAVVVGLAVYALVAAVGAVPGWLGELLAPVGTLLLLPLVVVHTAMIGAARSVGGLPASVRFVAVAVGIALSGAWWYLLAKTVVHGLASVNEPRD